MPIDSSDRSHLALCGCGWRGDPMPTKDAAHAALAGHEQRCHPDRYDVRREHGRKNTHNVSRP